MGFSINQKGKIMKNRLLGTILTAIMLTVSANAGCSTKACQGKIQRIFLSSSGDILIGTDGDESKLTCQSPGNVYLTISKNNPNVKTMYSAILTAQTTNSPITLRALETSTNCEVLYVTLDK